MIWIDLNKSPWCRNHLNNSLSKNLLLSDLLDFLNQVHIDGLEMSLYFFLIIVVSKKRNKIYFEGIFRAAQHLRTKRSAVYNSNFITPWLPSVFFPVAGCQQRSMKVILTFLPLAERQIIHRGSVIVSGRESERFIEDSLAADDKSGDITNKYLCVTTLLIFLALEK